MSYSIRDWMNQLKYEDYYNRLYEKPKPPAPEVPEFTFSPKEDHKPEPPKDIVRTGKCRKSLIRVLNHKPEPKTMPVGIHQTHGKPKTVPLAQQRWNKYQFVFEAKPKEYTKPPAGTAPTLEGLQRYLKRMEDYEAEWKAIAATQHLELPTVGQELAMTGITTYSMDSQYRDDGEDDADYDEVIAESDTTGAEYATTDLLNTMRRIEWEQYALKCGPVIKVRLTVQDGQLTVLSSQPLPKDYLRDAALRIAKAVRGRTKEELEDAEARIAYYDGCIGSGTYGVWTGEHPEWATNCDDLGADEWEDHTSDGGPQELGLHTYTEYGTVAYEPQPEDLWPDDADSTLFHRKEDWDNFWAAYEWSRTIMIYEDPQANWLIDQI